MANVIVHKIGDSQILHRSEDGYLNATAMCKAAGKLIGNYLRNAETNAFVDELSSDMRISISELIQSVKGGGNQGTWVHPKVAIHLAQWLSPKFAVQVTNWVYDWMMGKAQPKQPTHTPLLADQTINHLWVVMNDSGQVIESIPMRDAGILRGQVDKYFPAQALLDRDATIEDVDAVVATLQEAIAKIQRKVNPLITVLGTATNATQADADKFWRKRRNKSAQELFGFINSVAQAR